MSITAAELETNLRKYLLLAATQEIFITQDGETVAKLAPPHSDKMEIVDRLFGSVPNTMTLEEAREEHLSRL